MKTAITHVHDGSVSVEHPVAMVPGLGRVLMEPASSHVMPMSDGMSAILDTYTVEHATHYTVAWTTGARHA